jgi:putative methionine-R-sulfoxide reductase with GAF domain
VEKQIVSDDKDKLVLDEQVLSKLLEAAYVLQEHNRELQTLELGFDFERELREAETKSQTEDKLRQTSLKDDGPGKEPETLPKSKTEASAPGDYTLTLAQIVETQHQIQVRHLGLDETMTLVTERAREIVRASGASIGIVDDEMISYRAVSGEKTLPAGSDVPLEKALCVPCLRTGKVFRCADVNAEFLVDSGECHRRGIRALIAVPIFRDDEVAGGLELYFASPHAISDHDAHTCQLMAGLITEALAREQELSLKQSLASERAAVLEALEKLQPNLTALLGQNSVQQEPAPAEPAPPVADNVCGKCGFKLEGNTKFCGRCGAPRKQQYERPSMQSKFASLWYMHEAAAGREVPAEDPGSESHDPEKAAPSALENQPQDKIPVRSAGLEKAHSSSSGSSSSELSDAGDSLETELLSPSLSDEEETASEPRQAMPNAADWSSAASVRDFLEQASPAKRQSALLKFWEARRGDIYLAVAVLLIVFVVRWGIWSNRPVNATGAPNVAGAHHKAAPDADLSFFDHMLISLGLAEAPEPPEDKGNPSTQVWVDLHTALYYCPGADLYGKTPTGKYSSQREAQLDQFEPAYRKVCN